MKKENSTIIELLSWLAIAGNILFVLWILYNGINESFQGITIEKISPKRRNEAWVKCAGLPVLSSY